MRVKTYRADVAAWEEAVLKLRLKYTDTPPGLTDQNRIRQERERLRSRLGEIGFKTVKGEADFILLHSDIELYEKLLRQGILIRRCSNYRGMPQTGYYRIAVRLPEEDDILLEALEEIVKSIAAETEE